MTALNKLKNLFYIQTENQAVRRLGRFYHFLLGLLFFGSIVFALLIFSPKLADGLTAEESVLAVLPLLTITAVIILYLFFNSITNRISQEANGELKALHDTLSRTATRLKETQILYEFNELLATTMDEGEIYRRTVRTLALQLNVASCEMFVWNRAEAHNVIAVTYHRESDSLETAVMPRKDSPLNDDPFTGRSPQQFILDDAALDVSSRHLIEARNSFGFMVIPIFAGEELLGVARLFRQEEADPLFTQEEVRLAQAMARETAVALTQARFTADAQTRVAQLSSLYRLSLLLSEAPTLYEIFKGARREILSFVEATGMSIFLLTADGTKLDWIYGYEFGKEVDLTSIPPLPISQGLAGYVARQRETLYIDINKESIEKYQSFAVGADMNYWLGLPMIVANKLVGVLAIESDHEFSERDISLLKTMVGPLSVAINNLNQFEEIQTALNIQSEQRLHLQTAAEIAAAAASILVPDQLFQQAVHLIQERFGFYYVGLFLVDETGEFTILQAGTGEAGQRQIEKKHRLALGSQSLVGAALADGRPRISQDVARDNEWLANPLLPETQSELALPLQVRGQTIGALSVQSDKRNLFKPEMVATLQTLSDLLAIAIENARLLTQAEARTQQQMYLNQIGTQLHQTAEIENIVRLSLLALADRLPGTAVELHLGRPYATHHPAGPEGLQEK